MHYKFSYTMNYHFFFLPQVRVPTNSSSYVFTSFFTQAIRLTFPSCSRFLQKIQEHVTVDNCMDD